MILKHYTELIEKNHRKSDTVIFYGTGYSINDISIDDYEVLKKYDSMSLNWFIYHDFIVPRFYYRGENSAKEFGLKWKRTFNKKRNMYKKTIFLTKRNRHHDLRNVGVKEAYVIDFHFGFSKGKLKVLGPTVAYENCLRKFKIMENRLYLFGRSTVCPLLVLLYQMGYKEIVLYGIDLTDGRYFWFDRGKSEVHWRWNRERPDSSDDISSEKIQRKTHPNLESTLYFVPFFNDNYMNGNIFVGSKKSALSEHLKLKTIEELK